MYSRTIRERTPDTVSPRFNASILNASHKDVSGKWIDVFRPDWTGFRSLWWSIFVPAVPRTHFGHATCLLMDSIIPGVVPSGTGITLVWPQKWVTLRSSEILGGLGGPGGLAVFLGTSCLLVAATILPRWLGEVKGGAKRSRDLRLGRGFLFRPRTKFIPPAPLCQVECYVGAHIYTRDVGP